MICYHGQKPCRRIGTSRGIERAVRGIPTSFPNPEGDRLERMADMIDVTVFTRSSCPRTGAVRAVLDKVHRRFPIALEEVDVTFDAALEIAYGNDTPVVLIDGTEQFRREVDEHELNIILQALQMKRLRRGGPKA